MTTALPDPSDPNFLLVNGRKKWITNGMWADYATTLVRTSPPSAARPEYSLLIIPLRDPHPSSPNSAALPSPLSPKNPNQKPLTPGLTLHKIRTSGLHASGAAILVFNDVRVPVANLLGRRGHGFAMVMANFNSERLSLAESALTIARTCLAESVDRARKRRTFGRALLENQVCPSFPLVSLFPTFVFVRW